MTRSHMKIKNQIVDLGGHEQTQDWNHSKKKQRWKICILLPVANQGYCNHLTSNKNISTQTKEFWSFDIYQKTMVRTLTQLVVIQIMAHCKHCQQSYVFLFLYYMPLHINLICCTPTFLTCSLTWDDECTYIYLLIFLLPCPIYLSPFSLYWLSSFFLWYITENIIRLNFICYMVVH